MADPKNKPDYSGIESGSSTTSQPAGTGRTYTVVEGDSLSKIAQRFYGDAREWPRIHEANRNLIRDPDLIHPGQVLEIPNP